MSIARITPIVGSLYALMRQMLGLNVATPLGAQELSCTVAPDRRLVVLGHEPIAGFERTHGTVADEAAMLALHTLDSTTLSISPTFVAPGDSVLRTDDPGWRWHCIANHGQALSDWERRPLAGALAGLAVSGHTHAISAVTGLQGALDGRQPASTNLTALAAVASTPTGRALLSVAPPRGPKIPQLNADGSVTLIDMPSGSGGGDITDIDTCHATLAPLALYRADIGVLDADGAQCAASGAAVASWQDLTGHGYHLAPTGAAYRPTWQATALGAQPSVRFNATHHLRNVSLTTHQRNLTVVMVARSTATTQQFASISVFGLPQSGNSWESAAAAALMTDNYNDWALRYNVQNSQTPVLTSQNLGTSILPWGRYSARVVNNAAQLGWADTIYSSTSAVGGNVAQTGLVVGTSWRNGAPNTAGGFIGDLCYLIVFDRALSSWELGWLMRCLQSVYPET